MNDIEMSQTAANKPRSAYVERYNRMMAANSSPIDVARAALDVAYSETKNEVALQLDAGVALDNLIDKLPPEPLDAAARDVVRRTPSAQCAWNGWFALRATLATRKARIFGTHAFSEAGTNAIRRELATETYVSLAALLQQALEMRDASPYASDKRGRLAGALSEMSVVAALCALPDTLGLQASHLDDHRNKFDARMLSIDPGNEPVSLKLQVKTSADSGYDREIDAPPNTVHVVTENFFATAHQRFRMAVLIVDDVAGITTPEKKTEIDTRAQSAKDHILTEGKTFIAKQRRRSKLWAVR